MFSKMKRLLADPVESIALQVPRALLVSVLALAVDWGILEGCVHVFGMSGVLSAIIGYLIGGIVQYVGCSLWVFSVSLKNDSLGFIAFTILSLVGLGITWIAVALVHDFAGQPIELAKFFAVGLAFTWNFLSRKYLLFRTESPLAARADHGIAAVAAGR